MRRRGIVAAAVLAALCGLHFVPVPTGTVGQRVLRWLTPETAPLVLRARSVAWRFPLGARLDSVSIRSRLGIRAPRLEIGFSPWALFAGRLRIVTLRAESLAVESGISAEPLVATVGALDSVPLGRWFPAESVPGRVEIEALSVRTPEGRRLLSARGLRLRRRGQDLSLRADSLRFLGLMRGAGLSASGRLPFALDSLSVSLPGGGIRGRAVRGEHEIKLVLSLAADLDSLETGWDPAAISGRLRADSLVMALPFGKGPVRFRGHLKADSVALRGLSYARDPWARNYVPELARVGLGEVTVVPAALEDGVVRISSLAAQGDTLRLDGKGWLGLDGGLQLQMRVGLVERYAATRPTLLRIALQPGAGGFRYTSAKVSGTLGAMRLAPTAEAVAEAASNPLHALGELFR